VVAGLMVVPSCHKEDGTGPDSVLAEERLAGRDAHRQVSQDPRLPGVRWAGDETNRALRQPALDEADRLTLRVGGRDQLGCRVRSELSSVLRGLFLLGDRREDRRHLIVRERRPVETVPAAEDLQGHVRRVLRQEVAGELCGGLVPLAFRNTLKDRRKPALGPAIFMLRERTRIVPIRSRAETICDSRETR